MKSPLFILAALALVGCGKKAPAPAAYTPPEAIKTAMPTGDFNAKAVQDLEKLKAASSDPKERAIAEMLIISQQSMMGSSARPEELRPRLEALINEHPGTWISAHSRIGLMETYNPTDQFQKRIDTLTELLDDPGLGKLGDASDPYLAPFLVGEEAPHITANPRDYALFLLTYNYTTAYDLANAERAYGQLRSNYWKGRIEHRMAELRKTDQPTREKRREHFLKNQKGL